MNRFPLYPERRRLVLDGGWRFAWLGDVEPEAVEPAKIVCDELAAVPGCYDTAGERIGKRGVSLYRTTFEFPAGPARLTFGALGLYGLIYLDGKRIGEVKTPYATMAYDVVCGAGEHLLEVVLDNRYHPVRTPIFQAYFDFYGYGGIYRSVRIETLPELYIERAKVTPLDLATGKVGVEVLLKGRLPKEVKAEFRFDRAEGECRTLPVLGGALRFEATVPDFRIWSPESPALHTLTLRIGNDAVVERFGLRTVAVKGRDILLNGKPLLLLGLNRHEAHPEFGPVQPTQLMVDDLKWAKELGANFIRGAHYQQNPEFLELCDEAGFLVWSESLGWQNPDSVVDSPETLALFAEETATMVLESYNNPSVIINAFVNESCSETEKGRILYAKLFETVRAIDGSRPVSYASCRKEHDVCFDMADIIAINSYPGWINDTNDFTVNSLLPVKPHFDWLAEFFSKPEFTDKPLLVTEAGACGMFGVHDRARAQWTEEFQADYFHTVIEAILSNPRYCGITLWQMFDCRSYVNGGAIRSKPRGMNLAGLLDEYRRPKLAFDEVKRLFHQHAGK